MKRIISIVTAAFCTLLGLPAPACTDFQVKTEGGDSVIGRSMEWGADLHSRLVVHPRGEKRQSPAPGGKQGLSWTSKLGYVGVDANGLDVSVDGMNEKGLSFGLLWLPDCTRYPDISDDQAGSAIDLTELGAWTLGNFETVDQVKEALGKVKVFASPVPSFGGVPTAHIALHDAAGNNLVVEFVDGQQKIYDNKIGVLTNSPTFDWHQTNLRNYLFVHPDNVKALKVDRTVLSSPGQGSGFLGIPGDWTPPSRFVRTAAMIAFAYKVKQPSEGVNLAEHILNAVDIPRGTIRENVNGAEYSDYTQWALIKDLGNQKNYYRSYDNLGLKVLDLKKLSFDASSKKPLIFPIADGPTVKEVGLN